MAKPTSLLPRAPLLPAILLALLPLTRAASTPGALAPVSLYHQTAYSLARPCAAACLVYNGVLPCNVAGYYDLGVELACGRCGPINNCYCSAKLGSSATSYISSCVSANCARSVDSWPEEVTSMFELYDGYCATANVMPASGTKAAAGGATATKVGAGSGTTGTDPVAGAGGEGAKETAPASSEEGKKDKEGLSQSDIVALAASLGVGIPSLLIALGTLCVQLRKRKRAKAETGGGGGYAPTTTSSTALALQDYQTKPGEPAPAKYEPPPPTYNQHGYQPGLEAGPYPVNANAYPVQQQYAVHQQYPASHQYPTQQYQG